MSKKIIEFNIKQDTIYPITTAEAVKYENSNVKNEIKSINSQLNDITNEKANIYNDGLIFGIEYLTYYLDKVRKSESANIVISGDSQFCGVSLTNENYKIENLINNYFKSKGIFNITIINDAVSGARSSAWVSTYLAQDLAKNPDLYILKWGANDACEPLNTRFNLFKEYIEQGLQTIRASKNANELSIMLMSPMSTDDPDNQRTPEWFKQINPFLKEMARKYQCCFIDTYSYLMDSKNIKWQDEINYGSGYKAHVHPLESANALLMDLLSPLLLPSSLLIENGLWKDVILQNGWSNNTTDGGKVQYRKNENGEVEIRGCIKDGEMSVGTVLFTLPEGYRVLENITIIVPNGGVNMGLIKILSNGNVIALSIGYNTWLDFGLLKFKAEQ